MGSLGARLILVVLRLHLARRDDLLIFLLEGAGVVVHAPMRMLNVGRAGIGISTVGLVHKLFPVGMCDAHIQYISF
jgi:hypothetical protein